MKFGREQIEDIVRKISAKELNYIDSVVVGDNISGWQRRGYRRTGNFISRIS